MYAILDIKNLFQTDDINIEQNTPTYNQDPSIDVDDSKWLELIDNEDEIVLNY